jgi:ABC-type multidrug transport system ATPase subunit
MPATNAVEVEGLVKSFGKVHALRGVDLAVPAGTVLGLLGPNGAGKTTTVRVLTTLLKPDAGSARVAGHDVVSEAGALRAKIGLAGQYAAVDENLTGEENLTMVGRLYHLGKAPARARAHELLQRFDLVDARAVPPRRTPAACAAGSTSRRPSSPRRRSVPRRARRRGSIPAAGCSCGTSSRTSSARARPSC